MHAACAELRAVSFVHDWGNAAWRQDVPGTHAGETLVLCRISPPGLPQKLRHPYDSLTSAM